MTWAIGIVYSKDGSPRIERDFIDKLTPKQRGWVAADLEKHGFVLTDRNEVIKHGNSGNSGP